MIFPIIRQRNVVMKKKYVLFIFIIFSFMYSKASHLCGGDMRIEQIGANQFKVFARYFSINGYNTKECRVFDNSSNTLITSIYINFDSTRTIKYKGPASDTFNIHYYSSDTLILPNNTSGYYAVVDHGFGRGLNSNLSFANQLIFYCQIPSPSVVGGNSNPKFVNYPDSMSFCVGNFVNLDFSCTDADGDSLVYSLIEPNAYTSTGWKKPFIPITWNSGYNLLNILGAGSTCSINIGTGIITARSVKLDRFIVGVKCEEYRNGVKIGETIRDVPIPSLNCTGNGASDLKEEIIGLDLSIYPNPTSGLVTIKFESELNSSTMMEIHSVNGLRVLSKELYRSINQIDISDIEKGVYFIKLINGSKIVTKRIVIS